MFPSETIAYPFIPVGTDELIQLLLERQFRQSEVQPAAVVHRAAYDTQ